MTGYESGILFDEGLLMVDEQDEKKEKLNRKEGGGTLVCWQVGISLKNQMESNAVNLYILQKCFYQNKLSGDVELHLYT